MKEEKRKRANTTKEKQSLNYQLFDLEYFISLDNENKICFDCGGPFPTYVSINNGVFICSNCSKNHEKLGYNISYIYQINSPWDQYLLSYVLRGGNSRFKQLCQEYDVPCQSFDENDEEKLNKYIIELGNYHRLTLRSEILAEEPPKSLSFDDATKKCNLDIILFPELNDYHLYKGEMIPGKTTFGGKIWKGTKVTAKFIGHKGGLIFKTGKRILSNGTSKGIKYIGKHIWNYHSNNGDKKKNKDKIDISDYESVKNKKICLISPNNIFNDLSNGEESDEEKNIEIKCSPKHYAQIVREKARLRSFIKVSEEMSGAAYLDKEDTGELFQRAEAEFFRLFQERSTGDMTPIGEVVVKAIQNVESAYKNRGAVTGIATGFLDLDYKTAGLQPSDLILIAARPSMGKTAFVLNLASHIAVKNKIPTAVFSLEMNAVQLANRLLAMHSGVDAQKIRTGNLEDSNWNDLVNSARVLGESALMIDDTPGISIQELRSKCRKMKLEKNLQLVIIDYLQLMSGGKNSDSRQQQVSEISRSLKALAREINCPVIALSQLSREVEKRDDKRPILSDLRDSGAIEQDADVVMFLYRDEYYHKNTDKAGITEVIIGKQRQGPIGTVELGWVANLTRFVNLDRSKGNREEKSE